MYSKGMETKQIATKHNSTCTSRRASSVKVYGDPDYLCVNHSHCRCQCHKARQLVHDHSDGLHLDLVEGCNACDMLKVPVQPIRDTTSASKYGVAGGYAAMKDAQEVE